MKTYLFTLLAFAALAGCSVYNSDISKVYGIGSDQWHERVKER